MLLPLKPICPTRKIRKDGTCIIFIQYCKTGIHKTLLNTEIAIPPRYWHKKLRRVLDTLPTEYGDAQKLNEEIHRLYGIAEEIIKFALKEKIADPIAFVKKNFHPSFDVKTLESQKPYLRPEVNLDFFYQLEDYIKSKRKQVSPKMINVYLNLQNTLKSFQDFIQKPVTFQIIDYNFYEELVEYMLHDHIHRRRKETIKGFKLSAAGRTIKQLRIFLRNRMRKKIIPFIDLTDFKILDEESDAIYLTNDEITRIYNLDLSSKPHLGKYRDLFVVGCLTGLRFSDFSQIKPQDIRDGMLYKKQGKSDHWVVVPLRDQANFILSYKLNKKIPAITNPDFNYYIKEVGGLA